MICFSTVQWHLHTSRLCKYYLIKKESDGVLHQMTWPPQSPDLDQIGMSWTAEWRKSSQQVLSIVGTPSRLLEKHSRWSWLRDCQECAKLSSRQRVATLKNLKSKTYLDLFDTFVGYYMIPYVLFHSLMSSLLFYNVSCCRLQPDLMTFPIILYVNLRHSI